MLLDLCVCYAEDRHIVLWYILPEKFLLSCINGVIFTFCLELKLICPWYLKKRFQISNVLFYRFSILLAILLNEMNTKTTPLWARVPFGCINHFLISSPVTFKHTCRHSVCYLCLCSHFFFQHPPSKQLHVSNHHRQWCRSLPLQKFSLLLKGLQSGIFSWLQTHLQAPLLKINLSQALPAPLKSLLA